MDYIKILLIGLISVLAYLLLLEWSNFSPISGEIALDSDLGSAAEITETNKINVLIDSKDSLSFLKPAPDLENSSTLTRNKIKRGTPPYFFVENENLNLKIDSFTGKFISSSLVGLATENKDSEMVSLFGNRTLSDFGKSETATQKESCPTFSGAIKTDTKCVGSYSANSGFFSLEDNSYLNPNFTSLNKLDIGDGKVLYILNGENDGFSFVRKMLFDTASYSLLVEDIVGLKEGLNLPRTVLPYVRILRDGLGPSFGGTRLDNYTYLGPVFSTESNSFNKVDFEDLAEKGFQEDSAGGWLALVQRYFVSAWIPQKEGVYKYQANKMSSGLFSLALTGQKVEIIAGSPVSFKNTLYVGPKYTNKLNSIHPDLGLVVDYGFLWWLGQPIYWLMGWGFSLLGNWGFAILFSTIILKLILWPLSSAGYKSAAKMRALAPKMQELQTKHAGDKVKLGQETMAFYKKEGVSPLGGCLPMLLQLPFFIAFYWVLLDMVELRHSPFILWITDLSSRDPYFILPIFNGIFMYLSQTLMPITPSTDPTQQQMQKMMKYMPVFVCVLFAWFPAGFVLYFLAQTILTLIQQALAFRATGVPVNFK